jgi:hypothetical protein
MSLFSIVPGKMNKFEKLQKLVDSKKEGISPIDFFIRLSDKDFSRLELMILDSAIKKMPMSNLYNTLLLLEDTYLKIIDNLIEKLNILTL